MIVAAVVVAAVIIAAIVMTAIVAAFGAHFRQPSLQCVRASPAGRWRRAPTTDQQRGDENKGHWAFHLSLLSGSISIRCGMKYLPATLSAG